MSVKVLSHLSSEKGQDSTIFASWAGKPGGGGVKEDIYEEPSEEASDTFPPTTTFWFHPFPGL